MKLYLVQHADALSKDADPERRLSDRGRADAGRMAAMLAENDADVARVFHSGKTRAKETAALMVPHVTAVVHGGMSPNDPTDHLFAAIQTWAKEDADVMVVGHLPFMDRMAAHLVRGDADESVVSFQPGTVVILEKGGDGWAITGKLRPGLLDG